MIRNWLPRRLQIALWGDRKRWGLIIQEDDPSWKEWERTYLAFYNANQRQGIGTFVNDAGYRVMSALDLSGKRVLEIGAGDIRHQPFWTGAPKEYLLADIQKEMLERAENTLQEAKVTYRSMLLKRGDRLPLNDASVDVVVSFFSMEHVYPLAPYLADIERVLRPGGHLIGAIPAEGGLAWGAGRMLTSRRWLKRNSSIDPDKIICWEHPNFADQIIAEMDRRYIRKQTSVWPLPWLPLLDANLVVKFLYQKQG